MTGMHLPPMGTSNQETQTPRKRSNTLTRSRLDGERTSPSSLANKIVWTNCVLLARAREYESQTRVMTVRLHGLCNFIDCTWAVSKLKCNSGVNERKLRLSKRLRAYVRRPRMANEMHG
jgi:hypothetical protein